MRWLAAILLSLTVATLTHAVSLQTRLIRASNDPAAADPQLKELEPRLKKEFGYRLYRQLGAQTELLKPNTSQRLGLSEDFVVFAKLKSSVKKVHELDIEWYSGKTKLVATTLKMTEGSHVFIKGPGVGNDWIVLALTVRH